MNSVTSGAVSKELSYFTTEQATGKKWINGKTIYRKVIDFGALPNNTSKTVAHNITNIDVVISLYGCSVATNHIPIPYVDLVVANGVKMYMSDVNVIVETNTNRSVYTKTYIIVEYTKTTD